MELISKVIFLDKKEIILYSRDGHNWSTDPSECPKLEQMDRKHKREYELWAKLSRFDYKKDSRDDEQD